MTSTIYRYQIPTLDEPVIKLPKGARCLSVRPDRKGSTDYIDLWAVIDNEAPFVDRQFAVLCTGQQIETQHLGRFLGTLSLLEGSYIIHVFETSGSVVCDDLYR